MTARRPEQKPALKKGARRIPPNKTRAAKQTARAGQQLSLSKRLQLHLKTATMSLGRMAETPASSAMTILVIAIALLLPALLFALNGNLGAALGDFEDQAQITAYLEKAITAQQGGQVSDYLLTLSSINSVEFISSDQALAEFGSASGFDQVVANLATNPLPAAIVIAPANISPAAVEALVSELQAMEQIDFVEVDDRWLQRLAAISDFIAMIARLLMTIVVLGLFFIVGNTIKLAIENRRNEIRVIKLVGGTDLFIARPFLYTGMFYGLAGGVLALLLQLIVLVVFNSGLQELLSLYDGSLRLQGFGLLSGLALVFCGAVSAWLSALLVSLANIRAIDP